MQVHWKSQEQPGMGGEHASFVVRFVFPSALLSA